MARLPSRRPTALYAFSYGQVIHHTRAVVRLSAAKPAAQRL
jgi:hypothetical protein